MKMECKELIFHFNKKYLSDPSIPMWIIKTKGETYYINHLTSTAPWSTKETPDNEHTKGSLKFKNISLEINEQNEATITSLK